MLRLVGGVGSALIGFVAVALAATPPALLNYQGVLRSAANTPLSGTYDMTFRLFDDPAAGSEILVDAHTGGAAVTASGGLFNVQIGSGTVTDGSGPGTYTTLADVFRDFAALYLQVEVGGETLTPRTRVVAAAYALNASNLNGKDASSFLDTSSATQTKTGSAVFNAPGGYGLEASGPTGGMYGRDSDSAGYAYLGTGDWGIRAFGRYDGSGLTGPAAGYFQDVGDTGQAYLGHGGTGVEGYGTYAGGIFRNGSTSSYGAEALLASLGYGIQATGFTAGAYLYDKQRSGRAFAGYGDVGVDGAGNAAGGYFHDLDNSGYAYAGYGDHGVHAGGSEGGGYFEDSNSSARAFVAYGDTGIEGIGGVAGGYFHDFNNTGYAYLGRGDDGIYAAGRDAGGYFFDTDNPSYAYIGAGFFGIEAAGDVAGGHFLNVNDPSYAFIAGYGYGVQAGGLNGGVTAFAMNSNGSVRSSGYVGVDDDGLRGYGTGSGGYFQDTNGSGWANVAYDTYKIRGSGSVAFVQNHPTEKDQVVVYNAPEGDEVAVYTRGTARLVDGVARIQLGKTFAWVANPDLGLTAYVTPVGAWANLYVESTSTKELVVRSQDPGVTDLTFHYIVYGLRIGFEEVSIVQPKERESWIPSMAEHRDRLASHPDLRAFDAFERFKAMRGEVGEESALDLSASRALHDAIGEYDVATQGLQLPPQELRDAVSAFADTARTPSAAPPIPPRPTEPPSAGTATAGSRLVRPGGATALPSSRVHGRPTDGATTPAPGAVVPAGAALVPISETVESGDVVVLDPVEPGKLRRGDLGGDPTVAGIVAGERGTTYPAVGDGAGLAPVAFTGMVLCNADASYGAIRVGDLLVASATPGHAMRAVEAAPGTVIGKAAEGLEAGTGVIKVLVMLH